MASTSLIKPAEGLTFRTKKLQDAYKGMQEAYTEASSHVEDARKALESYAQRMGKIFARLSTDKSGKLDPDKNDGYKSVGEFAEKCGIKSGTAYAWRNWALAQDDPHLLPDIKALPISTYAALQSQLKTNEAEVVKAFKNNELSAQSSQDDVKKWSKAQREKSGAPRVVTQYRAYAFSDGTLIGDAPMTMDEVEGTLKAFSDEVVRLPDAAEKTEDGKESKVKRLLTISYEKGEVALYMLRVHKPEGKKPIAKGQDLNRKAKWTEAVSKAKALGLSDEAVADLLSDLYPEFYK